MYNMKIFGQYAGQMKNGYAEQTKHFPFPGTQRRFPQIETSAPKTNENGT